MDTNKLLFFALGLFVISVLIWGFATPALSETTKCKCEGKFTPLKMKDYSSFFIGVTETEGSCTCDNGETYTYNHYSVYDLDLSKGVDPFKGASLSHGYGVNSYKDNSKIVYTYKSIPGRIDSTGEAQFIYEGTLEFVRGTLRFTEIKGGISFKGKDFKNGKLVTESTLTYTLPSK